MSVHLAITQQLLTEMFEIQHKRALATFSSASTREQEQEACLEIGKGLGLFNVMLATVGSDVSEEQRRRWLELKSAAATIRMRQTPADGQKST